MTLRPSGRKLRGRPPNKIGAIPVLVRIPPVEMQPIDDWISSQGKYLTRSEAIRRLVEIGLKVRGK